MGQMPDEQTLLEIVYKWQPIFSDRLVRLADSLTSKTSSSEPEITSSEGTAATGLLFLAGRKNPFALLGFLLDPLFFSLAGVEKRASPIGLLLLAFLFLLRVFSCLFGPVTKLFISIDPSQASK
jgi:hypothetical protein